MSDVNIIDHMNVGPSNFPIGGVPPIRPNVGMTIQGTETKATTTTPSPPKPISHQQELMDGVKKMLNNENGGPGWWEGWEQVKRGYYGMGCG